MKVLVAIKRVVDFQVKIRVKSDGSGVETDNVKMSINPFDEIAVEEGIRWKEQQKVQEIVAVSIGQQNVQETLRHALALGVDRALQVQCDAALEPLHVAQILATVVQHEQPNIVMLGKQAIDNDCNQVGQMLAGLLNWPQGTFASRIEVGEGEVHVTREVDGGLETVALTLPAVITTDLRLNEPRFATLPNIMKSKSKPLTVLTLDQLGVRLSPIAETLHVEPPVKRESDIKIQSIREIMSILKEKEEVLP
ncbi:MAG: electron transfer flavoprotein subunit beta [Gammaproteobacteria bacterium RIFCSPHIGHO2_12_FULL_41_15]|nr:MAG: electron transfer flavoprotein subunit beta [Gammaproteobacteria bacterium RIFCSPHIGHO2_12_FULL_41_15]